MKDTQKSAKRPAATETTSGGWTDDERAAIKERNRELKASARRGPRADEAGGEAEVLEKIAEMREPDRVMAERFHALVRTSVPSLSPRLWYGQPAYAKDGKTICFFQPAQKFKTRYATLGFSDAAHLDEGDMWPTSYALTEWTAASEARIGELVRRAVS